jgi:ABC-2 type transport system permease protein
VTTVSWLTARGLFGRRRFLVLLPLPVMLIALAAVARSAGFNPLFWGEAVLVGLGLVVVLPVMALVVGTSALSSEIEDGTVVHLLTKPLPRWQIVLAKLAVAGGVTVLVAALPLFIAGVLADSVRLGLALAAASALGALAYSALFLAMSLLTRRPVLLGLVYVLIWEGLATTILPATRVLSIQQYVIAITDRLAPTDLLEGSVSVALSVVMALVITIGFTALAVQRLHSFSMTGETS